MKLVIFIKFISYRKKLYVIFLVSFFTSVKKMHPGYNGGSCFMFIFTSSRVLQSHVPATTRIQYCSLAPLSGQYINALYKRSTISSRRMKRVIDISTRITIIGSSSVDISVICMEAILSSVFFFFCDVR